MISPPALIGRKVRGLFTLAAALAVLLVACSDGTSTTTAESRPPTTTGTTTTTTLALGSSRDDAAGIKQLWVPAGRFQMGTGDVEALEPPSWATRELASEQPAHEVALTRGFWIDRFEVTNAAYAQFVADGGYDEPGLWSSDGLAWLAEQDDPLPIACADDQPDHPRACVTWFEAEAYAAWRGGRLPTEAEWEFAARGPESLIYPWGNIWDPTLTNIVNSDGTVPVGSFPTATSWVGAADMSGNVMEWVADWWSTDYYQQDVGLDPKGPATGTKKVEKGGWWGAVPYVGRAAYRHFEDPPSYQDHHIGFRVVADS